MSSMSMDYPALAQAVAEVRATAEELDRSRSTLHRSFASFLGGGWTGQAADSFVSGWDDWSDGVSSVLDALATIADVLEEHGQDVRTQDVVAELSAATLHARLGGAGGGF